MGVYIIGEKMPNNCTECFKHNKCHKYHIEIVKNEDGDFLPTYIADNCPLIEVTEPHGRLIDADKLFGWYDGQREKYPIKKETPQYGTLMMYEIFDEIDDAPTVIGEEK